MFGRTLRLLPYFMYVNSEGSGETARMRRLTWAFAGSLCDMFHISCAGSNVISDLYTLQVTLTHGVLTCNYHGPSSSAAWNLAEVWKYPIHNSRRWLQRRNLTALIRVQSTLFASAMIWLERWKTIQTIDSMQTNAFERYLVPCTV